MTAYPNSAGWKGTETSRDAAKSTAGRAKILQAECVRALKEHGPMTADEIAEYLGENILSIRPRVSELKALRVIYPTGARRKNKSGNGADVMEAV